MTSVPASGRRSPGKADKILGRESQSYVDGPGDYFGNAGKGRPGSGMSMETLREGSAEGDDGDDVGEGGIDQYEVSSNEDDDEWPNEDRRSAMRKGGRPKKDTWRDW